MSRRPATFGAAAAVAAALLAPGPAAPAGQDAAGAPRILYRQDAASATTAVQVAFRGGLRAAPPGREGLAYLATRLAVEVTSEDQARTLMGQSTRMRCSAQPDFSLVTLECLSANLPEAVRIAAEILGGPLFSGPRLDGLKDMMDVQAKAQDDDATAAGRNAARAALFGPGGYGDSGYGTDATRKALGRKDAQGFYKDRFTRAGMVVAAVSDLPREKVEAALAPLFARLPASSAATDEAAAPAAPPLPAAPVEVPKDVTQAFVGLAWRLPAASPRLVALAAVVEDLVGKGPGSRLWPLRTERKLAYNVNSEATPMRGAGLFEAWLESGVDKAAEAEAALREAMAALAAGGVPADELQAAKTHARAQFLRDTETKEARARVMAFFDVLGLGPDYLEALPREVEALAPADVDAFLKEWLAPEKAVLVKVGAKKK